LEGQKVATVLAIERAEVPAVVSPPTSDISKSDDDEPSVTKTKAAPPATFKSKRIKVEA
jgi:hypothetical protein